MNQTVESNTNTPDPLIGKRYRAGAGRRRIATVVDKHTTYNMAGDIVRIRYVGEYEFMGQTMRDTDASRTTILRQEITC